MKLLFVTLSTLFVVFILLLTARIWGLGQNYSSFDHGFYKPAGSAIVRANNLSLQKQAVEKWGPSVILWVDVKSDVDSGELFLEHPEDRLTHSKNSAKPAEAQTLVQALQQWPNQRFILNIVDNVMNIHFTVINSIKDLDPDQRILIQSETDVLLRSIKERKPQWLYGSSRADLMRWLSFQSIGILPATPLKGDVFIVPLNYRPNKASLNPGVIEELLRRNKKLIIGPLKTAEELVQAQNFKADGYVIDFKSF